jgi:hypothetical protein
VFTEFSLDDKRRPYMVHPRMPWLLSLSRLVAKIQLSY